MKRIDAHQIGVERGSRVMFSDFEDGGTMWVDKGARECRVAIKFSERYADIPTVHVALEMWDVDQKSNQRADISAENVTEAGFDAVFRTWGDTQVARVRVGWMSIGPLEAAEWALY